MLGILEIETKFSFQPVETKNMFKRCRIESFQLEDTYKIIRLLLTWKR